MRGLRGGVVPPASACGAAAGGCCPLPAACLHPLPPFRCPAACCPAPCCHVCTLDFLPRLIVPHTNPLPLDAAVCCRLSPLSCRPPAHFSPLPPCVYVRHSPRVSSTRYTTLPPYMPLGFSSGKPRQSPLCKLLSHPRATPLESWFHFGAFPPCRSPLRPPPS